jgi:hypothetical protein
MLLSTVEWEDLRSNKMLVVTIILMHLGLVMIAFGCTYLVYLSHKQLTGTEDLDGFLFTVIITLFYSVLALMYYI